MCEGFVSLSIYFRMFVQNFQSSLLLFECEVSLTLSLNNLQNLWKAVLLIPVHLLEYLKNHFLNYSTDFLNLAPVPCTRSTRTRLSAINTFSSFNLPKSLKNYVRYQHQLPYTSCNNISTLLQFNIFLKNDRFILHFDKSPRPKLTLQSLENQAVGGENIMCTLLDIDSEVTSQ